MRRANNPDRRNFLNSLVLLPWISACQAQRTRPPESPELRAQRQRVGDVALRLVVDAVPGAEMDGVEFFADEQVWPVYHSAGLSSRNRSKYDFPGRVPLKIRVVWRTDFRLKSQLSRGNSSRYDEYGRDMLSSAMYVTAVDSETQEIAKRQAVSKNTGVPHYGPWGSDYRGELAGDYTVDVAARIPDAVLQDLRRQRGNLRLKFRLKPDGVLFGWDIERGGGGVSLFSHAGGDFRETGIAYELPGYSTPDSPQAQAALHSGEYYLPPKSKMIWRKGWEVKPDGSRVTTDY
jgi:hypothetical protein